MENMVANEVVENAVEEVVTTKSKIGFGKFALVAGAIAGTVLLTVKGIKRLKAKAKAKKEAEVEAAEENWEEKLDEIAKEKSIDDLAE